MKYKDLKPCPFCGAKPVVGSLGGDKQNWSIYCPDCGLPCAENDIDETLDDIMKQWNRRIKMKKYDEWCKKCKFQNTLGCVDCKPCYYGPKDNHITKVTIESEEDLDNNHLKNVIKHSFPKIIRSLYITKHFEHNE